MAGSRTFDTLTLDSAPREAPAAFAQPRTEPLSTPVWEPGVQVSGAAPAPDAIEAPAEPGPPLSSLAPAGQTPRDPHEPFPDSTTVTAGSGEAGADGRDPHEPFALSGGEPPTNSSTSSFAPPDASAVVIPTASWTGGPAAGTPVEVRPDQLVILPEKGGQPVIWGVGALLRETGIAPLCFLIAGFVASFGSLIAFLVAWILSMTGSRSRRALRTGYLVAFLIPVVSIELFLLTGSGDPLDAANSLARWVCLALAIASPFLMRIDLKRSGRLATAEQAAAWFSENQQGPGPQVPLTGQGPVPQDQMPQGPVPQGPSPQPPYAQAPYPPVPYQQGPYQQAPYPPAPYPPAPYPPYPGQGPGGQNWPGSGAPGW